MSAVEMRGSIAGMELLRAQNTQLQNENDNLKRLLSQSERDREQDISYMRALLGRRLCRSHAQSFKLRRLLIKLHAQVLDIARVINIEQRTSEMVHKTHIHIHHRARRLSLCGVHLSLTHCDCPPFTLLLSG